MLTFVGLGLYDEMDVSVKGLEAIREADLVFAEFYTSHLAGATPERLAEFYGKEVRILSREEVEASPEGWINEGRKKKIAFLVGGDPMISTTHLDLRLRALRMGIVTRIVHSSSIVTAVSGLSGLQNYRFARSTSIPYPYLASGKRIVATSPYDVVIDNLDRNLHTLLFLDIQPDRYMTAGEGAALLLEMEEISGGDRLRTALGVGVARAGSDEAVVIADWLPRLADRDLGGPLHVLIVPGSLHFMEAEGLVALAAAPPEILDEAEP